MKDYLRQIVAERSGSLQKICAAREYLQAHMLQTLQDTGALAVKADKTVASAFIKFLGLLYELGLSPHPSQVLSIKLEVDTNPPAGAALETTLVRKLGMTLNLTHYDKASLLAGKLHALFTRRYTKGRDLYDLIWYLADRDWPAPNLELLAASLAQTGWTGPVPTAVTWRHLLAEKLVSVNWRAAQADVEPFLEREADRDLVIRDNVLALLMPKQGV